MEERLEAGVEERRGLGAQEAEEAEAGVSTTWLSLWVSRASLFGAGGVSGDGCEDVDGGVLLEVVVVAGLLM